MLSNRIYQVIRYYLEGKSVSEISAMTRYSPKGIRRILEAPAVRRIIARAKAGSFMTISEVASILQLAAPEILQEKIRLALTSKDEKIRSTNCRDLLEMAGHGAKTHIVLENVKHDDLADKSPEDIKEEILRAIGVAQAPTIH